MRPWLPLGPGHLQISNFLSESQILVRLLPLLVVVYALASPCNSLIPFFPVNPFTFHINSTIIFPKKMGVAGISEKHCYVLCCGPIASSYTQPFHSQLSGFVQMFVFLSILKMSRIYIVSSCPGQFLKNTRYSVSNSV